MKINVTKIKRIIKIFLLGLCFISLFSLLVIGLTGCSNQLQKVSENLTSYHLQLEHNEESQTLQCNENISYINNSNTTLNYLCFHLYPNAFRQDSISQPVSLANQHKAYPNGMSYGGISINNVNVLHNTTIYCEDIGIAQPTSSEIANFIKNNNISQSQYFIGGQDKNILYIIFSNPLYPDEKIEIDIQFSIILPNVNHRFGYGETTTNLGNFYPIACVYENGEFDKSLYNYNGDPFYSDMANYSVQLTTSPDFIISNTGSIISQNIEQNKQTINMEAKTVRDFAIVLSKKFNILSETVNNTEIKYYYFSDDKPEQSLQTSVKALNFFNDFIGKYPYSTLSVVETNFVHGGMEFPNLVYISNEVADFTTYQQVIVHEIAHQWWYNLVGNSEISYSWLDEGLTEYSTILFFDKHEEYGLKKDSLISSAYSNYSLFVQVYGSVFGEVDTSMNRDLSEFKTENEYVYIAYVKGMLLFDSLREILGEIKFEKCLQAYYNEYKFKNVTSNELISSFEKTSGQNLENYFKAWIDGKIILLN